MFSNLIIRFLKSFQIILFRRSHNIKIFKRLIVFFEI